MRTFCTICLHTFLTTILQNIIVSSPVIVNESDAVLIQRAKALDMADEKIKVKKKKQPLIVTFNKISILKHYLLSVL